MAAEQLSIDDLGRNLADVDFVVVDLETTGTSAASGSMITEIGAVRVRGGEVIGEFHTLVDPEGPIPLFIRVLTGITDEMVIGAPKISEVLPSFLQFANGAVLVAHNAPFDVGFLKHFARELDYQWPSFTVLDTARLARKVLLRDEVHNCKLSTLAAKFSTVVPDHRALTDARATVDVLHALFERLGSMGITTIEEVVSFNQRVSPEQRKKRHLAKHIKNVAGVYIFLGPKDEVLYVGKSQRLRNRVMSYFTASETRSRMGEMVRIAQRIDTIECSSDLEASVTELRLIAAHRPPYNRRSRKQDSVLWLKLTNEAWPRLAIVRQFTNDGSDYLGPFSSRAQAEDVLLALTETFPIRQCTTRMPKLPNLPTCALAEMKACLAPCDGRDVGTAYLGEVTALRETIAGNTERIIAAVEDKMAKLSAEERFEEAGLWRDRLLATLRAITRTHRLNSLNSRDQLIGARPIDEAWEVHIVRRGRLSVSGIMRDHPNPQEWLRLLIASAQSEADPGRGGLIASTAETEAIARWFEREDVRIIDGAWSFPLSGANKYLNSLAEFEAAWNQSKVRL